MFICILGYSLLQIFSIFSVCYSVLSHRLVQDRELQLTDGTRLMGEGRYQAAMQAAKLTPDQMEERFLYIHLPVTHYGLHAV